MPESLQLLDLTARQSATIFNQIAGTMDSQMKLKQQEDQFKAEQIFKAAQFAESQRVNSANIESVQQQNSLRAQEFTANQEINALKLEESKLSLEIEKDKQKTYLNNKAELAPLALEAERSRLEADRFKSQKTIQDASKANFDAITEVEDRNIAFDIIGTGSVDYVKDVNNIKSKYYAIVAGGGKYDPEAYRSELQGIKEKYKDTKSDTDSYSPEFQYALEKVSPALAKDYSKRSPEFKSQVSMVGASMLTMTPTNYEKNRVLYAEHIGMDNMALIDMSRMALESNQNRLDQSDKDISKARTEILEKQGMGIPENDESMITLRKTQQQLEQDRNQIYDESQTILRKGKQGVFGHYAKVDGVSTVLSPVNDQKDSIALLGMATATDSEASKTLQKDGTRIGIERSAAAMSARAFLQNNQKEQLAITKQIMDFDAAIAEARMGGPDRAEDVKMLEKQKSKMLSEKEELNNLYLKKIQEVTSIKDFETSVKTPLKTTSVNSNLEDQNKNNSGPMMGITSGKQFDRGMLIKAHNLKADIQKEGMPIELKGIDLGYFVGRQRKLGPDSNTLEDIKDKVESNISSMDLDKVITPGKVNLLFSKLGAGVDIPISDYAINLLREHSQSFRVNMSKIVGNESGPYKTQQAASTIMAQIAVIPQPDLPENEKSYIKFNGSNIDAISKKEGSFMQNLLGQAVGISSYESMISIVNDIPDAEERNAVLRELYGGLIAARAYNVVKN